MWCMWKRLHPNFIPCSTSEKPRWEKYSDTVTQVAHATVAAHSSLNWSHPGAHPDCLNCGLGLHLQLLVIRSLLEDTESEMNYLLHSRRWWAKNLFDRRTTWVLTARYRTWKGFFSPIGLKQATRQANYPQQALDDVSWATGCDLGPAALAIYLAFTSWSDHDVLYSPLCLAYRCCDYLLNRSVKWPS